MLRNFTIVILFCVLIFAGFLRSIDTTTIESLKRKTDTLNQQIDRVDSQLAKQLQNCEAKQVENMAALHKLESQIVALEVKPDVTVVDPWVSDWIRSPSDAVSTTPAVIVYPTPKPIPTPREQTEMEKCLEQFNPEWCE